MPVRELSRGGFGSVWLANQESLGRSVALKLLHFLEDPVSRQRFRKEAVLTAVLRHPNIVQAIPRRTSKPLNLRRRLSMFLAKNMQRSHWTFLGALCLLAGTVSAEGDQVRLRNGPTLGSETLQVTREERGETGAGFLLGPIGGMGFTFRRFDANGKGWQAGGLAYSSNDDTTLVLGGQRMWTLRSGERSRFYALAGATHVYDRERRSVYPRFNETIVEEHDDSHTNVGAGLGISLGSAAGAAFVVELPLVFTFEGTDLTTVAPIPQIALLYNY